MKAPIETSFDRKTAAGASEFDNHRQTPLPVAVLDLAMRLGADPNARGQQICLRQTGLMKPKLGARSWMPFTAAQTISTQTCAFDWRARAGPFGIVSARDALSEGEGHLDVMAFGVVPIARAVRSTALVRGELMRYLAELAWAPDAIVQNHELRWRADGVARICVSAGAGETAAEVVLSLDGEGRIAGAFAPDRPRSTTAPFMPTPWRVRFSDFRRHEGMWIPFAGEVGWEIDGTEHVYFQARIERWHASVGRADPSCTSIARS